MERNNNRRRGLLIALGIAALTAATVTTAQAAPSAAPSTATPNISSLRAEVRSGTLLATHGVRNVCATATQHLACLARVVTTARGSAKPLSSTAPIGYGPAELAAAYHLPAAGTGTGTIAILDAGAYPSLESDLATYRAQYGLPACTTASGCLKIADYKGGAPLTPGTSDLDKEIEEGVAVETSLDVDMASAACPSCKIIELQLPDEDAILTGSDAHPQTTDFGTAVDTAASLGANAISMSYQFPSDLYEETGVPGRDLFRPGIAVLASSGDGGFEGGQHTGWPQNLPWVTSVGGTSLYAQNAQGTKFSEGAWSGAGSGCETDLPGAIGAPSSVSAQCGGHRSSSDISAVADPATGVAVYDTYAPFSGEPYNWITVGGTSVASPFVGGLYARGGSLSQVIGPNTLYSAKSSAFNDITTGQNAAFNTCQNQSVPVALCDAGPGWDGPTGLGSPNGLAAF